MAGRKKKEVEIVIQPKTGYSIPTSAFFVGESVDSIKIKVVKNGRGRSNTATVSTLTVPKANLEYWGTVKTVDKSEVQGTVKPATKKTTKKKVAKKVAKKTTTKRGPGRPRKNAAAVEPVKKRGRPRKNTSNVEAVPKKRGPARPRKVTAEAISQKTVDTSNGTRRVPSFIEAMIVDPEIDNGEITLDLTPEF